MLSFLKFWNVLKATQSILIVNNAATGVKVVSESGPLHYSVITMHIEFWLK